MFQQAVLKSQVLDDKYNTLQEQAKGNKDALRQLSDKVSEMQKRVIVMRSRLEECKRKNISLGNRLLKVLVAQEIESRRGLPIQADEEKLISRVESIAAELRAQTMRLNELKSQLNFRQGVSTIQLDDNVIEDIIEHLDEEQKGIEHLMKLIKSGPQQ